MEEGEEDSFDEDECRELATEMYYQYQKERFPPCGFVRNNNGEIITKHDKGISDRKNCQRLFQVCVLVIIFKIISEFLIN